MDMSASMIRDLFESCRLYPFELKGKENMDNVVTVGIGRVSMIDPIFFDLFKLNTNYDIIHEIVHSHVDQDGYVKFNYNNLINEKLYSLGIAIGAIEIEHDDYKNDRKIFNRDIVKVLSSCFKYKYIDRPSSYIITNETSNIKLMIDDHEIFDNNIECLFNKSIDDVTHIDYNNRSFDPPNSDIKMLNEINQIVNYKTTYNCDLEGLVEQHRDRIFEILRMIPYYQFTFIGGRYIPLIYTISHYTYGFSDNYVKVYKTTLTEFFDLLVKVNFAEHSSFMFMDDTIHKDYMKY